MPSRDKGTYLTLENRKIIQSGIEYGATKTSIPDTIGKDNSTIGKEIARHRIQKNSSFSLVLFQFSGRFE